MLPLASKKSTQSQSGQNPELQDRLPWESNESERILFSAENKRAIFFEGVSPNRIDRIVVRILRKKGLWAPRDRTLAG